MSAIGRLGILLAPVLMPCAAVCFSNASRSSSGPSWKPSRTHLRLAAFAQHHRMMIEGRGEIGGVLLLGDQIEAEDVGVVLDLLVEIGRLIGGVGDLLDADHCRVLFSVFFSRHIVEHVDHDGDVVVVGEAHVVAMLDRARRRGRRAAWRRRSSPPSHRSCRSSERAAPASPGSAGTCAAPSTARECRTGSSRRCRWRSALIITSMSTPAFSPSAIASAAAAMLIDTSRLLISLTLLAPPNGPK